MAVTSTTRESPFGQGPSLLTHREWSDAFPWLVQGITGRGSEEDPLDFRLWGEPAPGSVLERWEAFRSSLGAVTVVHGQQVHGPRVVLHRGSGPGLHLVPGCDGHASSEPGVLMTVALADCVPVYLVASEARVASLLHAGWRGTAEGILERALALLSEQLAVEPGELHLHLGPAICGECYEVGPEVHRALGLRVPEEPAPVDLRGVLAARAAEAGVREERVTLSEWCTRCGDSPFFSHREGDRGRHLAFLGIGLPRQTSLG